MTWIDRVLLIVLTSIMLALVTKAADGGQAVDCRIVDVGPYLKATGIPVRVILD